ncbi:MAG TPA: type III-A CRISPR-associated RAMP protein Csm5 [Bryobacteraceae bacterium]|jgi:CRISPR-associated protein Csm5|nr:type III-A CRISPR-associated RAMP protein Csm5 [Bryobacteraceae bacterium]
MQYRVTVLTPLLVGDGRELSPVDYMVWKDQVNVLDQTRIFKLLARGPRLEGYLTQLRKATKLDFASWGGFAQNFSQRRIPFESTDSTVIWNAASSENLFIPTFTAGHRGAYLPGSALKGALRTGLVFSRWNDDLLDRLEKTIEGDRLPRRVAESAENSSGASQVRVVAAADSDSVPTSAFKIYLTRVASLDTRSGAKPQLVWKVAGRGSVPSQRMTESTALFAEMAVPGTTFTGDWREKKFLENPELTHALGWRSVPDPQMLFAGAHKYAAAQLNIHAAYAQTSGLSRVSQTVERLRAELTAVQESQTSCLLCLGWGGGFLSKAAVLNTERESYRNILKAVPAISRSIRDGLTFPKTRRVVFSGGQPATLPGWVRLEFS